MISALPVAPTDLTISEVSATSVRLEWSYKGPEDLQYYVIQYKPRNANQAYSEISGIITMFYVVRSLSPYTEYEFYVIAVNNIGRGPASAPAVTITGETGKAHTQLSSRQISHSNLFFFALKLFSYDNVGLNVS